MRLHLLAYGFRPLFLGAGLAAAVLLPLWIGAVLFDVPLATAWPAPLWHAHEMLFGFIAAAIGGFLLTAVPSWTGRRGFAGRPLGAVSLLWLVARLAVYAGSVLPWWAVAALDVAFLPAIGVLIAPPLLRERNRNTPLLGVLLALAACNAVVHAALAAGDDALARRALLVGIDVVLVLVTVIGGRIVPVFTASALKQRGITAAPRSDRRVEAATLGLMLAIVVVDAAWPDGPVAGGLALAAALAHALRASGWRTLRTLREPIVWSLHLGYAWLPAGLLLKGLALLGGYAFAAFWLHALTVGALATLILAVMTRASLGHTGRPLVVAPGIAVAYALLSAAAAVRVFGPSLARASYPAVLFLAALLWTAAFVLYLIVYLPVLLGPRVDGRPG